MNSAAARQSPDPGFAVEDRFILDDSTWPIVVTRVPHRFSEQELARFFDQDVRAMLGRGKRYASAVDATRLHPTALRAGHRAAVARYYDEFAPLFSRLIVAECYVISSPVVRGVLQAIRWLSPPRWPTQAVSTMREAENWLTERLPDAARP